jgi:hypothetical protein
MKLLDKFRSLIQDCETVEELNDCVEGLTDDYREELQDEIEEKREELSDDIALADATDAELAAEVQNRPELLDMLEEAHFSDEGDADDEGEDEDDQEDSFDPDAARDRVESFAEDSEDTEIEDAMLADGIVVRDVVEDELQPIPSAVRHAEEQIEDADLSGEELEAALNQLDQLKRDTGLLEEDDASRQTAIETAEQLDIDVPEGASTEQILTLIGENAPDVTRDHNAQEDSGGKHLRDLMGRAFAR